MKTVMMTIMITLLMSGCTKKSTTDKLELKTDMQKMYYALGYQYGDRIAELTPSERELKFFKLGLTDGTFNQKKKIDTMKFSRLAGAKLTEVRAKAAVSIKSDGIKFIKNEIEQDPDFKKTETGLVFKILKKGNLKNRPTLNKFVKIEFKAKHLDGSVFDQTSPQNIPVLPLNGIIKAWKEGLQLIGKGGEIVLIAPSHLAYGDAGAPPKIKGGETIIFEMKLIDVFSKLPKKK